LVLAFLFFLTACQGSSEATPFPQSLDELEITFLNNAGFLIESGEDKILIDGLYKASMPGINIPDELLQQITAGESPFDDIDLVLVTHQHSDHFSAAITAEFLENNPDATLISSQAVVDELLTQSSSLEERSISLQLPEGGLAQLIPAEIELEVFQISHGVPGLLNLGYLIDLPGGRLFHSGDLAAGEISIAELQAYGLPEKELDIALLPYYMFLDEAWAAHLSEGINARYLVPMHYSADDLPEEIKDLYPDAILFDHSHQSWELPLVSK
jgi:L-ascorbate metabolism protein UlaG (beta-lactamase superfamily)